MQFFRFVEIPRGGGSTRQSQRTEPCPWVSGQPWASHLALQGQMKPLHLGRWLVGVAGLPVCGAVQRNRQHSATTANRALPVCEWPVLGMPWATVRSKAASALCSRCGESCTGCCGRAELVVCGYCCIAECWCYPDVEALLGHHIAQSPASV